MFKKILILAALCSAVLSISVRAQDVAPDELVRKSTNEILAALKADKDLQAGDTKKVEKLAEDKIGRAHV